MLSSDFFAAGFVIAVPIRSLLQKRSRGIILRFLHGLFTEICHLIGILLPNGWRQLSDGMGQRQDFSMPTLLLP
jgi:hypothetical protein